LAVGLDRTLPKPNQTPKQQLTSSFGFCGKVIAEPTQVIEIGVQGA
jgi:hypothetical protein